MARRAKIVSNEKRRALATKYGSLRKQLKESALNPNASQEERMEAQIKLQTLPRNSSPVRVRNRCLLTGRSRGVYRQFRLSRLAFRRLALSGMIPGITKSSW